MRLDKFDAYTAWETLGYRGKRYVAAARGEKNNQSSPMKRREEPMEEQSRVNEENDRNTQRQETVVTGREKVDEVAIKKMGTQGVIATKPKPVEKRHPKERGTKENYQGEKHRNRKFLQCIKGGGNRAITGIKTAMK